MRKSTYNFKSLRKPTDSSPKTSIGRDIPQEDHCYLSHILRQHRPEVSRLNCQVKINFHCKPSLYLS